MSDQLRLGDSAEPILRPPRVTFLEGLFASWLTKGERVPRKAERELAERAAQAAVEVLDE